MTKDFPVGCSEFCECGWLGKEVEGVVSVPFVVLLGKTDSVEASRSNLI